MAQRAGQHAAAADGVTRFLAAVLASREDLRELFADLRHDGLAYLRWVREHGMEELQIPPALVPIGATPEHAIGELRDVQTGEDLGFQRGDAVVCIPLYGAHDLFVRCLSSVLAHTPRAVSVLIADDAGPDPASRAFAETLASSGALSHRLLWLRQTGQPRLRRERQRCVRNVLPRRRRRAQQRLRRRRGLV